ncbi:MAG TPA: S8 family serine peptidase [Ideonella sp.]|nr:S8 family serine peptidase [Ideonella sp.]
MKPRTPSSHDPLRRALAAAAATLGLASPGLSTARPPPDPQVAGNMLLRLSSTAALSPLLARYQLSLVSQFGARPIYRVQVAAGADVDSTVEALSLEPEVVTAEPNFVHSAPEARKNVVWAIGTAAEYTAQWAPQAMRLPEAQLTSKGAGVRVAVLDTGVDASHPALAGKLLPGRDFVDGDNDPAETGSTADAGFGHGTHVAGLVALAAPEAKIVPLRVLDAQGSGDIWVLAQALLYAIDPDGNPATNDGAQVVNLSMGTLERTRILDTVMQLAACSMPDLRDPANLLTDPGYDGDKRRCSAFSGAVIVAAAGNGGNRSEKQYPAAEGVYGLLPMGASAQNERMAAFSNRGSWVDVAAPGDRVTSSVPGGGYGTWSGTSMASPLAAGAAALLRARFPKMKPVDVAKRIEQNGARLCGDTNIVQVDAAAALKDREPPDLDCR